MINLKERMGTMEGKIEKDNICDIARGDNTSMGSLIDMATFYRLEA